MRGYLFVFFICGFLPFYSFSGEAEVRLSEKDGGKLNILLIVTNLQGSGEWDKINAVFSSQSRFALLQQVTDLTKAVSKLYISSESSIKEAESFLASLGFEKIRYNGQLIETVKLSEEYVPVKLDEVKTINRQ